MDYIWGINLKELCRAKKKIPGKTILRWGIELCDVLDYLHNQKPPVIYRDLKPENLIIGKKGKLSLVDFGIALIRDRHSAEDRLGTAGYAAPEQYRGRAAVQSDIYGLGMVLKELVKCGRYQGEESLCPGTDYGEVYQKKRHGTISKRPDSKAQTHQTAVQKEADRAAVGGGGSICNGRVSALFPTGDKHPEAGGNLPGGS